MTTLKSLLETYKTAVFQKDVEAFASIFDEEVLVFDMWQHWTYEGLRPWKELVKAWFRSLGSDKDVVTFSDVRVHEGGELAVVTAVVRFTAVSEKGEELRYLENRLTWMVRKKDGVWRIIHQHTSSPVDLGTMKVILQRNQ